ncbi:MULTISPECIES: restriction endonuclease subunit S [unclassified Pseudoalteromonas]|uniref:restriction endonuclease subunit S n=1 Tax=unclassified Pseudoalteromonas TaxID=194690 RepID=UPI0011090F55|nr:MULTISPECIES: restriction endonuclease subunit S [unclassified Pseudoalteromonas]TMN83532.1 restriction endonuclease [Pseudoalteromonas sp. S410]TMN88231.1 restriction endonuclease [Pseudoalteromonas sp. S408]TMN94481.1 restriction endonuclease [Pseudoalteromonas sp. S407]TMN99054.1 restriction endonuclease [Pseudoalteromonas sp. S409]TMO10014.1 restriction endonuclease [Pseudoalteromonas sp. S186]
MAESNTPTTNTESLITEHLDIWTTAIEQKSSAGRGSSKKFSLHGIKKLRELILELAVRGKLVPQDPNDEPASVLLERIAAEKAQLIKDKKIKKPKVLPEISEHERPIELPKGWSVARLGEMFHIVYGKGLSNSELTESGYEVFGANGIIGYYSEYKYEKEQLLVSCRGAYSGKPNISPSHCFVTSNSLVLENTWQLISLKYFFYSLAIADKKDIVTGSAQPQVTTTNLEPFTVLIPPYEEQQRIVAKVDELMDLCDKLEAQTENSIAAHQTLVEVLLEALLKAPEQTATPEQASAQFQQNWQRLSEHFDTLFTTTASINTLKQTILQLAVMGKLVPQNPNDEPAAKLLERIAAEKAQLTKDKKIKKQKPLPEITEEEKPFELPSGWEWCRLPDLGELARGKSKHRPRNDPKLYKNGTIPLVQTGDVARSVEVIETYTAMYNEVGLAQSQLWPKGTLCITIAANIADTGILGFDACFPDSVVGYTCFEDQIPTKYFDYFIRTAKANLEKFAPSTAQKNINLEILSQVLVPCPPLEEFERVVNKVDELLTLCDQLKARLTDAQTTKLHLTDAIVEQAV